MLAFRLPARSDLSYRGSQGRFAIVEALIALLAAGALGFVAIGAGPLAVAPAPMLLVVALAPFVVPIVGSVQRTLLAVVIVDVPLQIDSYLSYRKDADAFGAVSGFNVSITTLALIFLYGRWIADALAFGTHANVPVPKVRMSAIVYFGVVAASLIYANDVTLAAFDLFLLAQLFLLSVYMASWIRTPEDLLVICRILFLASLAEALLIVASGGGIAVPLLPVRSDAGRIAGTFGSPNYAGAFFAMTLAPALSVIISRAPRGDTWLAGAALGVGTILLALTSSRGAWASAALSLGITCLVASRRRWMSASVPVAGGFLAVGLVAVFGRFVQNHLAAEHVGSAQSRVPLLRLAQRIIEDHWLFGVGANNFVAVMPRYLTPDFSIEWVYIVHNKYLLVWAETGVIGLASFLLFLFATLRSGVRGSNTSDRLAAPIALGMTASVAGMMVQMLVEYFTGRTTGLLWIYSGVLAAVACFPLSSPTASPIADRVGNRHRYGTSAPSRPGSVDLPGPQP